MQVSSWPGAVIFDLDGTLVDTLPDIATSLNSALTGEDLPPLPVEKVRPMIGSGARILIERALSALGHPHDMARITRLEEAFETHYGTLGAGQSEPYPGALQLLKSLHAQNVALGVCTNKPESAARMVLSALAIEPFLHAIVGANLEIPKKPDPTMLINTLAALAIAASDALVVGDSETDVAMARAAGVSVVVVSYGYTTTPAHALGADRVINHLGELPEALATLRASKTLA